MVLVLKLRTGDTVKFFGGDLDPAADFVIGIKRNVFTRDELAMELSITLPGGVAMTPDRTVVCSGDSISFKGTPIGRGEVITVVAKEVSRGVMLLAFILPESIDVLRNKIADRFAADGRGGLGVAPATL